MSVGFSILQYIGLKGILKLNIGIGCWVANTRLGTCYQPVRGAWSHLGGAYYGLVRQKKSREVTFSLVAFLRSSYGINEMKTEASSHL